MDRYIDMSGGRTSQRRNIFLSRQGGKISLHLFKTSSDRSSYSDFNQPVKLQ